MVVINLIEKVRDRRTVRIYTVCAERGRERERGEGDRKERGWSILTSRLERGEW